MQNEKQKGFDVLSISEIKDSWYKSHCPRERHIETEYSATMPKLRSECEGDCNACWHAFIKKSESDMALQSVLDYIETQIQNAKSEETIYQLRSISCFIINEFPGNIR